MLENSGDRWLGIMHTSFSMVRMYGGDIRLAMTVQVFVAIASLAVLVALWRRKDASLAVKGAALVGVSLLASPYSFYYDEVILAIPIALLARRGIETGFLPYEKLVLFMLWLLPVLAKDSGESYRLPLGPPLFACLIYMCWRRAAFERLGTVSPVRS